MTPEQEVQAAKTVGGKATELPHHVPGSMSEEESRTKVDKLADIAVFVALLAMKLEDEEHSPSDLVDIIADAAKAALEKHKGLVP